MFRINGIAHVLYEQVDFNVDVDDYFDSESELQLQHQLHGIVIHLPSRRIYTLHGTLVKPPKDYELNWCTLHKHQNQFCNGKGSGCETRQVDCPLFYHMSVLLQDGSLLAAIDNVERESLVNDAISLSSSQSSKCVSQEFKFITQYMKVNLEAKNLVQKYFSHLKPMANPIVCVGQIEINIPNVNNDKVK
ncbi:hypothetical protein MIR68_010472 [Amoeboaphelidium protococcarum]|nr:hypothetical protein MIR68_010472 [Amoeboaphelidium protococcarum]